MRKAKPPAYKKRMQNLLSALKFDRDQLREHGINLAKLKGYEKNSLINRMQAVGVDNAIRLLRKQMDPCICEGGPHYPEDGYCIACSHVVGRD